MNKNTEKHAALVIERNKLAKGEGDNKAAVKVLDAQIGRLAAAFNPKVSEKAIDWLKTNAENREAI